MKKKILITGFEPFLGQQVNPSELVAKKFTDHCDVIILPVSYQRCWPKLHEKIQGYSYDFVLMLGQAGGRKNVCLEKIAVNFVDSEFPDEDGKIINDGEISKKGPAAFFSHLPLRKWQAAASRVGIELEISTTAGLFVCNYLYFQMLQHGGCSAVFVHLPYLPEQGSPSLNLEKMEKAVGIILDQCRALGATR